MGQSHSSSKHTAGEIDREKYQKAYHVLSAGQEALTLERFQVKIGQLINTVINFKKLVYLLGLVLISFGPADFKRVEKPKGTLGN